MKPSQIIQTLSNALTNHLRDRGLVNESAYSQIGATNAVVQAFIANWLLDNDVNIEVKK